MDALPQNFFTRAGGQEVKRQNLYQTAADLRLQIANDAARAQAAGGGVDDNLVQKFLRKTLSLHSIGEPEGANILGAPMQALDWLGTQMSRLGYGVRQGAMEAAATHPETAATGVPFGSVTLPKERFPNPEQWADKERTSPTLAMLFKPEFWRGAGKGVTLKEKPSFSAMETALGNPQPGVLQSLVGELITDPGNFIPPKAYAGALGLLGKGAKAIPGVTRALDVVAPLVSTRYIRQAGVGAEEMTALKAAQAAIRKSKRVVRGQGQEAVSQTRQAFKGIGAKAAEAAAPIVESGKIPGTKTMDELAALYLKDYTAWWRAHPQRLHAAAVATPEAQALDDALARLGQAADAAGVSAAGAARAREVKKLAKGMGIDLNSLLKAADKAMRPEAILKRLADERRLALVAGATDLPPEFARLASTPGDITEAERAAIVAQQLGEATAAADLKAGIKFDTLPDYLHHRYLDPPEKVRAALGLGRHQRISGLAAGEAGFQKPRKLVTLEAAEAAGLHPIKDVRVLTAARELAGIRQRGTATIFKELQDIGEAVMRVGDDVPPNWVQVTQKGFAGVPGQFYVHPEVGRWLHGMQRVMEDPTELTGLWRTVRKLNSIWGSLQTAAVPQFHAIQLAGNVFNSWVGGGGNPRYFALALSRLRGLVKGVDAEVTLYGKTYKTSELLEAFRLEGGESGGIYTHVGSTETVVREIERGVSGVTWLDDLKKGRLLTVGRRLGAATDNWTRFGHFLNRLAVGDDIPTAMESVRKCLFEYDDITPAMAAIRGTLMPFLTWRLKNTPFQVFNMLTQPWKYKSYLRLRDALAEKYGVKPEEMSEWQHEMAVLPIGKDVGKDTIKTLNLQIPAADINVFKANPAATAREGLAMLSPLFRGPLELATGQNMLTGQKLPGYPGETVEIYPGGPRIPWWMMYGLNQVRPLGEVRALAGQMAAGQGNTAPELQTKRVPGFPSLYREQPAIYAVLENLRRQEAALSGARYKQEREEGTYFPAMSDIEQERPPTKPLSAGFFR